MSRPNPPFPQNNHN
ncbi:hypothetical protein D030_1876A, partial [Vibrio parahaemolyticus AQ3810]